MKMVIAIDGPAGTGKSSVAKECAKILNFIYVDTGAIYRALAYAALQQAVDPDDVEKLLLLIDKIKIIIDEKNYCTNILFDNKKLDKELRTMEISRLSSVVSSHEKIREALLYLQRNLINHIKNGAIFEGRDIGSVVFPYAPLKIFITASPEERAKRRYEELIKQGEKVDFLEVLFAIKHRDERDGKRAIAPMQMSIDAIKIDSSHLTKKEVTEKMLNLIKQTKIEAGAKLW